MTSQRGPHPRNHHTGRYDFEELVRNSPALAPFVAPNPHDGEPTIDFADPEAVRALNRALLKSFYGIASWEIPAGYLCPPIPGRADYLHHLADLLASVNGGEIPRGGAVRVLDIGVGANCIYPIIGNREYGWRFVGSDIDPQALASARRIVEANPELTGAIELRRQPAPPAILPGVVEAGDEFELLVCNPPFHASLAEAREGSRRKWRNLGRESGPASAPARNFGGQGAELWCPGGEAAFTGRLIAESAGFSRQIIWYSTLVSKESTLPGVARALKDAKAAEHRIVEMAQGQKRSRLVAWTFHSEAEQVARRERRRESRIK